MTYFTAYPPPPLPPPPPTWQEFNSQSSGVRLPPPPPPSYEDEDEEREYLEPYMGGSWLWYLLFVPASMAIAAISLRDLHQHGNAGQIWALDAALKLVIVNGVVATCLLPILIGTLCTKFGTKLCLGAFLLISISFSQLVTVLLFRISALASKRSEICQQSFNLLGQNCLQLIAAEALTAMSFFPLVVWALFGFDDLLTNIKFMLTFTIPKSKGVFTD